MRVCGWFAAAFSPLVALAIGCGGATTSPPIVDADARADLSMSGDMPTIDKAATCASHFGNALTNAFGRLDGTVRAVVPPGDETCADPNSTHLTLEITMGGKVYRMVVDVLSDQGPPDVYFYELDAPLIGGAWADGWHTNAPLDYLTNLNVHSTQFAPLAEADLVAKITAEIALNSHISVFATSQDETDAAHLVHRNLTNKDGAIVINPDAAHPHYLLMHFDEQVF